jgi:hypothetical protein
MVIGSAPEAACRSRRAASRPERLQSPPDRATGRPAEFLASRVFRLPTKPGFDPLPRRDFGETFEGCLAADEHPGKITAEARRKRVGVPDLRNARTGGHEVRSLCPHHRTDLLAVPCGCLGFYGKTSKPDRQPRDGYRSDEVGSERRCRRQAGHHGIGRHDAGDGSVNDEIRRSFWRIQDRLVRLDNLPWSFARCSMSNCHRT